MASNRFWAGSNSDSDSGSDSTGSSTSDDSDHGKGNIKASRWDISESSSDEEEGRVVRSAKDKLYDAVHTSIDKLKKKVKVNDWSSVEDEFKILLNTAEKGAKVFRDNGAPRLVDNSPCLFTVMSHVFMTHLCCFVIQVLR
jgi:translation initiation factor 3 subunit C